MSPKQGCADVGGDGGRIGSVMAQFLRSCFSIRRGNSVVRLGIASALMMLTLFSIFASGASAKTPLYKWSPPVLIGSKGSSATQVNYSVSCPTSTFCVSVNGDGQVSYYRSGVWSSSQPLALVGSIDAVSCASKAFCVAVGAGKAALYNGHAWSSAAAMGPVRDEYKVSCPTSTFCAAVGANGIPGRPSALVTFNGHSWTTYKTNPTGTLNDRLLSVSCSSPQFCMATNFDGQILAFNGTRWTRSHGSEPGPLVSVSCTASQFCMAVAITGASTTFHSGSWSPPKVIPAFKSAGAYSVSCVSAAECSVIGLSGAATTWISGRWSSPLTVFPGRYVAGVAISCSPGSSCVAVNDRGMSASR